MALATVTVLAFVLIVNSSWTATPDGALYLSLGESLARGEGYVFNGKPHTFVPPGYPLILAAAADILGNSFFVYRILMAVLGLLTAAAGYLLILRLCGRDVALLAGGLFALNHVLLENSALTLADVPFAFFTLVSLNAVLSAAHEKNRGVWLILAGLLASAPPLIRINGLGVPPAAAFFLFCSWKDTPPVRRLCLIALFLILAYAPTSIWVSWKSSFPASFGEGSYLDQLMGRQIQDELGVMLTALWGYIPETSYALTGVVLKTGILEFVAPLVALIGAVGAWRRGDRLLVPLTVIQYGGLLLSPAGSRYVIFLIPALYMFLALGLLKIADRVAARTTRITPRRLLVGCFALLALLNVGHDIKTIVMARMALEPNGAESARSLPYFTAARWLNTNAPDATVLTAHSRIIHYLSGCRTITLVRSGVPEQHVWVEDINVIKRLITEGKPEFFFADTRKSSLDSAVLEAAQGLGLELKKVPEASSSRYRLFKFVKSPGAG